MTNPSVFDRMNQIDRRVIYLVLAIVLMIPMFRPVGFPIYEDPLAVEFYETISSMPAGSTILYSADFDADGLAELRPMLEVMIDLSLQKGHRIVLMTLWAAGNNLLIDWTNKVFLEREAVYGEDYINLGYIPSYAGFLEASRTNFHAACNGGVDNERQLLSGFPIMADIRVASDFDAVVCFSIGDPGYTHWVQFWSATGEVQTILAGVVSVNYPGALNAYNAGNLRAVVAGINGAATLEKCHGTRGRAYGASDAQSFGHLAIIAFLILGNIGYFGAKYTNSRTPQSA